jgi:hypothetical protein
MLGRKVMPSNPLRIHLLSGQPHHRLLVALLHALGLPRKSAFERFCSSFTGKVRVLLAIDFQFRGHKYEVPSRRHLESKRG